MNEKIESFFIKALQESKVVDKDDIKRVGEETGLEFAKKISKEKVILQIVKEGHLDRLYEAFEEFIYIPSWEVADFYNINTDKVDKLQEIKVIKEEPVLKEFYSRKDKGYYTANTYSISVLQNYTEEELKTAYKQAYEQDGYRTRVEAQTEEEIHNLINELEKNFKISNLDIYSKRNEGFYAYFIIKKLNNSRNEENAMLVEIQKLKNEITELRKKNIEEKKEIEQRVYNMFGVKNRVELLTKSYEFKALKNSKEKARNERGAGRKNKFSEHDKEAIKLYRLQDKTIKEIAEIYNCSVGLIHKIISEK